MKLKNYCILVLTELDGVKKEILKIAESKPRYVDATGMLMCTFASQMSAKELENFFNTKGRSFFIFEVDKDVSGYNLHEDRLHKHLFGYLVGDDIPFDEKLNMIVNHVSASTVNDVSKKTSVPKKNKFTLETLKKMHKGEREKIVNNIIDKGVENMTDSDKALLKKISEIG